MDCKSQLIICFVFFTSQVYAHPFERRETFDPNVLMEQYMNVRTDQNDFGSFHPNDLIRTITEYFKNGGGNRDPDNLWGLFVYNPNANREQYMSRLDTPGSLGPKIDVKNNFQDTNKFDPGALNQKLVQPQQSLMSVMNQNGVKQATNQYSASFDPDSVNQNLMKELLSGSKDSFSSGFEHTQLGGDQQTQSSIKPIDASLKDPDKDKTGTSAAGGFNPDMLNANLLSSVKYNPGQPLGPVIPKEESKGLPLDSSFGLPGQNSGFASIHVSNTSNTEHKYDTEHAANIGTGTQTTAGQPVSATVTNTHVNTLTSHKQDTTGTDAQVIANQVGNVLMQSTEHTDEQIKGQAGIFNGQITGGLTDYMTGGIGDGQNLDSHGGTDQMLVGETHKGEQGLQSVGQGQVGGIMNIGYNGALLTGSKDQSQGQEQVQGQSQGQDQSQSLPPGVIGDIKLQQTAPKPAVASGIGGLG